MSNRANDVRFFTAADSWSGGDYGLYIELGPRSDDRLSAALSAIWSSEGLRGWYLRRDVEPDEQPGLTLESVLAKCVRVDVFLAFGLAVLPNAAQVACRIQSSRYDDRIDAVDLGIPMGALATAYKVGGYPFGNSAASFAWRRPLDAWLTEIATRVFSNAPFKIGLIGHEPGPLEAAAIQRTGIPNERAFGCLEPTDHGLALYPATF